jgi:hypothetical protein
MKKRVDAQSEQKTLGQMGEKAKGKYQKAKVWKFPFL